jgi:hypothetical protein
MLNIFNKKQNTSKKYKLLSHESLTPKLLPHYINKEKNTMEIKPLKDEYKNIIYYPASSKEWFSNIYSYNKSYIKPLIVYNVLVNDLFRSYFNMVKDKVKILFKRRRHNKKRYSSNKIFVSRSEVKHTNTKLLFILYIYNKKKYSIERFLRNLIISRQVVKDEPISIYRKRLVNMIKNMYFLFKKWNMPIVKITDNLLEYHNLKVSKRKLSLYKIPRYNNWLVKKLFRLEKLLFNYTKAINFNKLKFNNLGLTLRGISLIPLIQKIYNKKVEIKIIELKSIHLNSDIFSSAVALKLRDRKNKAVRVLRKAVLQMVKIPDLHTLRTFYETDTIYEDNNIQSINGNKIQSLNLNVTNLINTIKQQVVSGVRFEAAGRLTRRLTAMRAVFKYRYMGSLKNIPSSLNNKSAVMLRGYVKSNLQYTIQESKTRNGSFGLKSWVSSH